MVLFACSRLAVWWLMLCVEELDLGAAAQLVDRVLLAAAAAGALVMVPDRPGAPTLGCCGCARNTNVT